MPPTDPTGWELPESHETDDGVVRWARLGTGGHPVVLVHGTPYSSFLWRDVAPALARTRTVYVFDLLGYGRSDRHEGQDLTLAAQARRFAGLLDHWGLTAPSVVANDIGGAVVLRAHLLESARYRDLTVFDAVSGGRWERGLFQLMREHPEVFAALPGYAHEALVAAHLRNASHRGLHPDVLEAHLAPWRGPEGQAAFYRQYRQLAEADTRPYEHLLDTITVPVRLLWGRHDRILPPEYGVWLHERIPHSTLHWFDDAGHLLQEDRPAELTAHLLDPPPPRA
ncbi:alpha/beta hydrolase [Pseudonocardia sp. EC080610-09]|uniref:alpha/beta fold hydrolase n=1 Tax=unclassified Pseudonocardia TaxID=2619320 RepID=UPI0006CB0DA0|nr:MULTISPECIES: alpha/beta hydrolase [unclassified Pseudonocardia]ALE73514.1 alpha/beta hydrolase [Pseudonocardia sp. EC080625-04]ALL78907.1 alpha/beta hydrolase [Pseudonocardia sp. EC080610-09]ALL85115.1 alpha/beta hydrolase [Pseudonocardia sp. EC080619-01]